MPNNYYERQSEMNPGELADGLAMEQEFDAIGRGFSKLPEPHRDGRGFEGPTRVGDPIEKSDALNLGSVEKLNIQKYIGNVTKEDWNAIITPGIYDVRNATGNNAPNAHPYGTLVVNSFNGVVSQSYYPDKFATIIRRVCEKLSDGAWSGWDAAYSFSMGQASFRNKVINGAFIINQRGYASGSAVSPNQYTLDRWKVGATGGVSFSNSNGKVIITIPAGQTLKQVIEGGSISDGDYVLSWVGSADGRINGGAYGRPGKVKANLTGGADVIIEFSSGTVSFVQLELGLTNSPFEYRPYSIELILCQRYFEIITFSGEADSVITSANSHVVTAKSFKVDKRASPTFTHNLSDASYGASWLFIRAGYTTLNKLGSASIQVFGNKISAGFTVIGCEFVIPGTSTVVAPNSIRYGSSTPTIFADAEL